MLAGAAAHRELLKAGDCSATTDPEEPGLCAECHRNGKKCLRCGQDPDPTVRGYAVNKAGTGCIQCGPGCASCQADKPNKVRGGGRLGGLPGCP